MWIYWQVKCAEHTPRNEAKHGPTEREGERESGSPSLHLLVFALIPSWQTGMDFPNTWGFLFSPSIYKPEMKHAMQSTENTGVLCYPAAVYLHLLLLIYALSWGMNQHSAAAVKRRLHSTWQPIWSLFVFFVFFIAVVLNSFSGYCKLSGVSWTREKKNWEWNKNISKLVSGPETMILTLFVCYKDDSNLHTKIIIVNTHFSEHFTQERLKSLLTLIEKHVHSLIPTSQYVYVSVCSANDDIYTEEWERTAIYDSCHFWQNTHFSQSNYSHSISSHIEHEETSLYQQSLLKKSDCFCLFESMIQKNDK